MPQFSPKNRIPVERFVWLAVRPPPFSLALSVAGKSSSRESQSNHRIPKRGTHHAKI
jgi:hypothetical protein